MFKLTSLVLSTKHQNTDGVIKNEMLITDYVLEYNNFNLEDDDSEKVVSKRYENRHLKRPLSCLTPHISQTHANICITLISLETTFTGLHFRR